MKKLKNISCELFGIGMLAILLVNPGSVLSAPRPDDILTVYPQATGDESIPSNDDFTVRARIPGGDWQDLFNYNVKVRYYSNGSNASMVYFSFSGTIEMEVTYNSGTINSFMVRPASFGINPSKSGNKLTFTVTQNLDFPRKFVVIINGKLDECLHILGNPPEVNPPSETDENVWVVEPGKTMIPLPPGKDTYYFKAGIHKGEHLGEWAELDLGQAYFVNRIELVQKDYAHRFKVYSRNGLTEDYILAYDGSGNRSGGTVSKTLTAVNGRYIKVQFFKNTSSDNSYACRIREFRVFQSGSTQNLALNKYRIGSSTNMKNIADGNEATAYENKKSAGRMWLYANGQKMYIPGTTVVQGGVQARGLEEIEVRGRGIFDGSHLTHITGVNSDNRVGPIMDFTDGQRINLEGFITLDNPGWGLNLIGCHDSKITNVSMIGYAANSDGMWITDGDRTRGSGCFIRTSDDIVATYAGKDQVIENSVFWGDKAHVFWIGKSTGKMLSGLICRNVDVIGHEERLVAFQGVMALHLANDGSAKDLLFEDIRIAPFRNPQNAKVFMVDLNLKHDWARNPGNTARNITFKNISYEGSGEMAGVIRGVSVSKNVDGVHFINYKRQGNCVTNASSGNISVKEFVTNVTYTCNHTDAVDLFSR